MKPFDLLTEVEQIQLLNWLTFFSEEDNYDYDKLPEIQKIVITKSTFDKVVSIVKNNFNSEWYDSNMNYMPIGEGYRLLKPIKLENLENLTNNIL